MTDIDLEGFDIKVGGKTYRTPFHPPMTSMNDARPKLVEMDRLASLYLKKSDITVKKYVPPYGLSLVSFLITAGTWIGYSQRWWFEPGGPVETFLGPQYGPAFAKFSYAIQPRLLLGLVLIHGAEVFYFTRYKLVEHSVSARAPQFWLWAVSVFIEGIGAQLRFKRAVDAARVAKEKQRH